MNKALVSALLLLASFSLVSCAQKSGDSNDSASTSTSADSSNAATDSGSVDISSTNPGTTTSLNNFLRVTTYNLGLLPAFVSQVDERVGPIAERLANDSSDVLCVQEVWRDSDRIAIEQRIGAQFPFSMRINSRQKFASSSPACSLESFTPIAECLISNCSFSQSDLIGCATNNCRDSLFTLAADDPQCAAALFAQSGRSSRDILEIQDELLSDSTAAGLFAFDGNSGVAIYSKLPLNDQSVVDFFDNSTTSRRVALLANVEVNGKTILVGCTHLSSNLDGILPYTGNSGSWEGENFVQAGQLISQAQNSSSDAIILAGDFNCSEENPNTGAGADFAPTCSAFRSSGFEDQASNELRCSFCNENILNQSKTGQGEQRDLVLDHLFSRGISSAAPTELLYTELLDIDGNSTNLSDHYGVSILFSAQ